MDLAAAEGREARGTGGEDGGDKVGAGAEHVVGVREEREREVRVWPRERGDEDRVGAEVGGGGGDVGVEGAERVGEAASGGVEGDELRQEDRVRVGGRGDD